MALKIDTIRLDPNRAFEDALKTLGPDEVFTTDELVDLTKISKQALQNRGLNQWKNYSVLYNGKRYWGTIQTLKKLKRRLGIP